MLVDLPLVPRRSARRAGADGAVGVPRLAGCRAWTAVLVGSTAPESGPHQGRRHDRAGTTGDGPARRRDGGEEDAPLVGPRAGQRLSRRRLHLLRRAGRDHRVLRPRPGHLGHPADAVHGRGVHPRPGAGPDRRVGPGDRQHDAGPAQRDARQDRRRRRRPQPHARPAGQSRRRAVRGVLPGRADQGHRRRRVRRQRTAHLRAAGLDRRGEEPGTRPGRRSCEASAATGWSAWPSGCHWPRSRCPGRSSPSSSP